jgi:hypothetical protein
MLDGGDMPYTAYQCETFVVVTDVPVEESVESWPLSDEAAALVIDEGAPFEVVDGALLVNGEPV